MLNKSIIAVATVLVCTVFAVYLLKPPSYELEFKAVLGTSTPTG